MIERLHGRAALEQQLAMIQKTDAAILVAEAMQAKGAGKSKIWEKLDAKARSLIEEEARHRAQLVRDLYLLHDPIRAEILRLHYTQGYTAEELAHIVVGTDTDAAPILQHVIQRLLDEGTAAFDRLDK